MQTIPGHDGFDAMHAVLETGEGETRLFGTGIMATQYAATLMKTDLRLEDLKPIAKVTNGFSIDPLRQARRSADDMGRSRRTAKTPLKLSSLQRQTATYIAVLMAQRKGGLAPAAAPCAIRSAR